MPVNAKALRSFRYNGQHIAQGDAVTIEDQDIVSFVGRGYVSSGDYPSNGERVLSNGRGPYFRGWNGKLRLVYLGDSIVAGDGDQRNNFWASRELCWNLAVASRGVLLPARLSGTGGQMSPQIAQRAVRDALLLQPDVVGVSMGTNDAITFGSAQYITAALTEIHNALSAAGVFWFVSTIPPNNGVALSVINAVNAAIREFAHTKGVPLADFFTLASNPASPGQWRTNWSHTDLIHPHCRTSKRFAELAWEAIKGPILQRFRPYRAAALSVSNLLFPATANTGLPSSGTAADPLFLNFRTLNPVTNNGYGHDAPYLFGAHFSGGTPPTVTATVAPSGDVNGNLWSINAAPNGAGSYSFQTQNSATLINVSRFQGRRIRIDWLCGCEGFDVDNTDAVLAAANSSPVSGFGLSFAAVNAANASIANTNFSDPADTAPSLGTASTIPCEYQAIVMAGPAAAQNKWCMDIPLTPMSVEFNVPVGAVQLQVTGAISFTAGAVSPVVVKLGEFCVRDVGPSQNFQIPQNPGREHGYITITAATTLTAAQVRACRNFRVDATAGAVTVTLPAAASILGFDMWFKKIDSSGNAVTIARAGSDTLDGATSVSLASQYNVSRLHTVLGGFDVY